MPEKKNGHLEFKVAYDGRLYVDPDKLLQTKEAQDHLDALRKLPLQDSEG
jgi:hypothetical protein